MIERICELLLKYADNWKAKGWLLFYREKYKKQCEEKETEGQKK